MVLQSLKFQKGSLSLETSKKLISKFVTQIMVRTSYLMYSTYSIRAPDKGHLLVKTKLFSLKLEFDIHLMKIVPENDLLRNGLDKNIKSNCYFLSSLIVT